MALIKHCPLWLVLLKESFPAEVSLFFSPQFSVCGTMVAASAHVNYPVYCVKWFSDEKSAQTKMLYPVGLILTNTKVYEICTPGIYSARPGIVGCFKYQTNEV